jgi:hypothetical protein
VSTTPKNNDGFVAIIIAVIVGVVIILIAISAATSGYYLGSGGNNLFWRSESYIAAYSCFDIAWFQLDDDLDYTGNETVTVGPNTCQIETIDSSGTDYIIRTNSTVNRNTTRLEGTLDELLQLTTLKEI